MPEPTGAPEAIRDYHAHVYFDAETKAAAVALREEIGGRFEVSLGRVHERPIGPHPEWSYQVAFGPWVVVQVAAFIWLIVASRRRG